MKEKLKIPYPIIVEGKYDRLKILSIADALVITTDGFSIFKAEEKKAFLRVLSRSTPLIVLTDSDGGGKVIRSHISSVVPRDRLIQLYVPRIEGKESRKNEASKEGILGVEGMESELIYELLLPFSDNVCNEAAYKRADNPLSKTDFYIDGLTGSRNSSLLRDETAKKFGLPSGMTPNALLEALRVISTYDEYLRAVGREEDAHGSVTETP